MCVYIQYIYIYTHKHTHAVKPIVKLPFGDGGAMAGSRHGERFGLTGCVDFCWGES